MLKRNKQISVQQTIPYLRMLKDGICQLTPDSFSCSYCFTDINYDLLSDNDRAAVFARWSELLNYFDSTVHIQLSFINFPQKCQAAEFALFKEKDCDLQSEFAYLSKKRQIQAFHGLDRNLIMTLTIHEKSLSEARMRFNYLQKDISNYFSNLRSDCKVYDGIDRLNLLHRIFRPHEANFNFHWDMLPRSGLSTKDYIAPSSFNFNIKNGRAFSMGNIQGSVSFMQLSAAELSDQMIQELLDRDKMQIITIHIDPIDQMKALKMVKQKLTDLDKTKIDEQKKAVRAGYDMDIMPADLETYGVEAKQLLKELTSKNEKMFLVTILLTHFDTSKKGLKDSVDRSYNLIQRNNCVAYCLDYQQEEGLLSSLPLGINQVPIQRSLTTSSTAVLMPFRTAELNHLEDQEALEYGVNAITQTPICVNRKALKAPNALILGTPGSGKSVEAKLEIIHSFLKTDDDIQICDPEGEYYPVVQALGGQVLNLDLDGANNTHINPLDINANYSDGKDPLALKSDFILSLCSLMMGAAGLSAIEKTIIDRCTRFIYKNYFNDPMPENMPILQDLYNELQRQPEPEAMEIAAALELYVSGSLNIFNHHTNVQLDNRLICFVTKELGKQLKEIGMLIINDQVWNRVTLNREKKKSTRYYVDEFHLLLHGVVAGWVNEIWKRFRKWGGLPTGITQNVKHLLRSPEISDIVENTDFILMLNQGAEDRKILCERLGISPAQEKYITNSKAGSGLVFYGDIILPFENYVPKDSQLYKLISTKLAEKLS